LNEEANELKNIKKILKLLKVYGNKNVTLINNTSKPGMLSVKEKSKSVMAKQLKMKKFIDQSNNNI
jgi:hypothetical protein